MRIRSPPAPWKTPLRGGPEREDARGSTTGSPDQTPSPPRRAWWPRSRRSPLRRRSAPWRPACRANPSTSFAYSRTTCSSRLRMEPLSCPSIPSLATRHRCRRRRCRGGPGTLDAGSIQDCGQRVVLIAVRRLGDDAVDGVREMPRDRRRHAHAKGVTLARAGCNRSTGTGSRRSVAVSPCNRKRYSRLDAPVLAFLESRFGHDFARVLEPSDSTASRSRGRSRTCTSSGIAVLGGRPTPAPHRGELLHRQVSA
jgi:hypothetical protein